MSGGLTAAAADPARPMVEAVGLGRWFGASAALAGVDLAVAAGEIFGLLGTNGAGKSTLLKILATVLPPSAGWARVDGLPVQRAREEVRRVIGYMPDPFMPYEDLRTEEYLEYFARIFALPRREALIADLLRLVGLDGMGRRMVGHLSKGMRQRLGVARCLLHGPKVLLLDEPASGLDPGGRRELIELLRELRAMGKTVVVTSHILPELAGVCDRFAILHGGRVARAGTAAELCGAAVGRVRLLLRLAPGGASPEPLLTGRAGVRVLASDAEAWELDLAGGEAERAALLGDLARSGVLVREFEERPLSLDEAFLAATGCSAETSP